MAWIYLADLEGSISSQGSEESQWPWSHGCKQSPIVKTTDTLKPFCFRGCDPESWKQHRSGTTCGLCGLVPYPGSTSSLGVSPARTSPSLELERAWRESEADYFSRSCASQMSFGLDGSSSKTSRESAQEASMWSSKNLQLWGMTVGGRLYQPPRLEPRTSEKDGSFLPTPTAQEYGTGQNGCPGDGRESYKQKGKPSLSTMARRNLWPTPTVYGNHNSPKAGTDRGTGLSTAVKSWPTPRASDWKDCGDVGSKSHQYRLDRKYLDATVKDGSGGALNPRWVEWLMGYPIGWLKLGASETAWFRSKSKRRLKD